MDVEEYTLDDESEGEPRSRRMEMVAGVALVVLVIGFVLFNYVKGEVQGGHYHAGVDALSGGELDKAVSELQASEGYLDSAKLIEQANAKIEDRDAFYKEATDFASVGKWWQASQSILDMQEVQKSYKDSDALLARAREVNGALFFTYMPPYGKLDDGTSYRVNDMPDHDGVYSMQADGKQADQIPDTVRNSQIYALSPDGQNLVFSIPDGAPRVYNFAGGWITPLDLPDVGAGNAVQGVIFSADGKTLLILTANTVYTFDMGKVLTKGEDRGPISQESKPAWQVKQVKELEVSNKNDGTATIGLRVGVGYNVSKGAPTMMVATEQGRIDGALFSKDQHYLMYRVCTLRNGNRNFDCSLRLVDLQDERLAVQTVATETNLTLSAYNDVLLGEFTRDGEHYVVFTNYPYRHISNAVLYNIKTGEANKLDPKTFGVTTGRGENDVYVEGEDYLVDDYVPGLEDWIGGNSLGHTSQNLKRSSDGFSRVMSHWISVSNNGKFVVALSSHITESTRFYRLWSTSLTWNSADAPDAGRMLFSTKSLPKEWVSGMRMLGDGYTVAASVTEGSDILPSVIVYGLDKDGKTDVELMSAARLLDGEVIGSR